MYGVLCCDGVAVEDVIQHQDEDWPVWVGLDVGYLVVGNVIEVADGNMRVEAKDTALEAFLSLLVLEHSEHMRRSSLLARILIQHQDEDHLVWIRFGS